MSARGNTGGVARQPADHASADVVHQAGHAGGPAFKEAGFISMPLGPVAGLLPGTGMTEAGIAPQHSMASDAQLSHRSSKGLDRSSLLAAPVITVETVGPLRQGGGSSNKSPGGGKSVSIGGENIIGGGGGGKDTGGSLSNRPSRVDNKSPTGGTGRRSSHTEAGGGLGPRGSKAGGAAPGGRGGFSGVSPYAQPLILRQAVPFRGRRIDPDTGRITESREGRVEVLAGSPPHSRSPVGPQGSTATGGGAAAEGSTGGHAARTPLHGSRAAGAAPSSVLKMSDLEHTPGSGRGPAPVYDDTLIEDELRDGEFRDEEEAFGAGAVPDAGTPKPVPGPHPRAGPSSHRSGGGPLAAAGGASSRKTPRRLPPARVVPAASSASGSGLSPKHSLASGGLSSAHPSVTNAPHGAPTGGAARGRSPVRAGVSPRGGAPARVSPAGRAGVPVLGPGAAMLPVPGGMPMPMLMPFPMNMPIAIPLHPLGAELPTGVPPPLPLYAQVEREKEHRRRQAASAGAEAAGSSSGSSSLASHPLDHARSRSPLAPLSHSRRSESNSAGREHEPPLPEALRVIPTVGNATLPGLSHTPSARVDTTGHLFEAHLSGPGGLKLEPLAASGAGARSAPSAAAAAGASPASPSSFTMHPLQVLAVEVPPAPVFTDASASASQADAHAPHPETSGVLDAESTAGASLRGPSTFIGDLVVPGDSALVDEEDTGSIVAPLPSTMHGEGGADGALDTAYPSMELLSESEAGGAGSSVASDARAVTPAAAAHRPITPASPKPAAAAAAAVASVVNAPAVQQPSAVMAAAAHLPPEVAALVASLHATSIITAGLAAQAGASAEGGPQSPGGVSHEAAAALSAAAVATSTEDAAIQQLLSLPVDVLATEPIQRQLKSMLEARELRLELERMEQRARLEKMKRQYQREEEEAALNAAHEAWLSQQKRLVREAKIRKALVKELGPEVAATYLDLSASGGSGAPGSPQSAAMGASGLRSLSNPHLPQLPEGSAYDESDGGMSAGGAGAAAAGARRAAAARAGLPGAPELSADLVHALTAGGPEAGPAAVAAHRRTRRVGGGTGVEPLVNNQLDLVLGPSAVLAARRANAAAAAAGRPLLVADEHDESADVLMPHEKLPAAEELLGIMTALPGASHRAIDAASSSGAEDRHLSPGSALGGAVDLDAPSIAAYRPAEGVHLLFDALTGLPPKATKVQVAYCFYVGDTPVGDVQAVAPIDTEVDPAAVAAIAARGRASTAMSAGSTRSAAAAAGGSPRRCVVASQRIIDGDAGTDITLVVEVQRTSSEGVRSVGWSLVPLFRALPVRSLTRNGALSPDILAAASEAGPLYTVFARHICLPLLKPPVKMRGTALETLQGTAPISSGINASLYMRMFTHRQFTALLHRASAYVQCRIPNPLIAPREPRSAVECQLLDPVPTAVLRMLEDGGGFDTAIATAQGGDDATDALLERVNVADAAPGTAALVATLTPRYEVLPVRYLPPLDCEAEAAARSSSPMDDGSDYLGGLSDSGLASRASPDPLMAAANAAAAAAAAPVDLAPGAVVAGPVGVTGDAMLSVPQGCIGLQVLSVCFDTGGVQLDASLSHSLTAPLELRAGVLIGHNAHPGSLSLGGSNAAAASAAAAAVSHAPTLASCTNGDPLVCSLGVVTPEPTNAGGLAYLWALENPDQPQMPVPPAPLCTFSRLPYAGAGAGPDASLVLGLSAAVDNPHDVALVVEAIHPIELPPEVLADVASQDARREVTMALTKPGPLLGSSVTLADIVQALTVVLEKAAAAAGRKALNPADPTFAPGDVTPLYDASAFAVAADGHLGGPVQHDCRTSTVGVLLPVFASTTHAPLADPSACTLLVRLVATRATLADLIHRVAASGGGSEAEIVH